MEEIKIVLLLSPTKIDLSLQKKLEEQGIGIIHLPIIRSQFLTPPIQIERVNYLLFTSKTAVKGINRLTNRWQKIPIITVGPATAREVERLGGRVFFSGNGYGSFLAKKIPKLVGKGKILFPRPEVVATPVAKILRKEGIDVEEVIIYRTLCRQIRERVEEIVEKTVEKILEKGLVKRLSQKREKLEKSKPQSEKLKKEEKLERKKIEKIIEPDKKFIQNKKVEELRDKLEKGEREYKKKSEKGEENREMEGKRTMESDWKIKEKKRERNGRVKTGGEEAKIQKKVKIKRIKIKLAILFSSPSTVNCFFKQFRLKGSGIGEPTNLKELDNLNKFKKLDKDIKYNRSTLQPSPIFPFKILYATTDNYYSGKQPSITPIDQQIDQQLEIPLQRPEDKKLNLLELFSLSTQGRDYLKKIEELPGKISIERLRVEIVDTELIPVAIGKKTFPVLQSHWKGKVYLSPAPSINGMLLFALQLLGLDKKGGLENPEIRNSKKNG